MARYFLLTIMTSILVSPQLDRVRGVQFESNCLLWPVACYNVVLFLEYQTQDSEIKRKTILSDMFTLLTPPSSVIPLRALAVLRCRGQYKTSHVTPLAPLVGSSRSTL